MGKIPATTSMISSILISPKPGQDLPASTTFTISVQMVGLAAGSFTNPQLTYYSAPQNLDGSGKIIGHTHVTVQDLGKSLTPSTPPDPTTFVFFKGINDAGNNNGLLSASVAGGLPAGNYRVCTMASSSNHQPVLMPVAQRGAQDDCTKFTVGGGAGGGSSSGSTGSNTGAVTGSNGGAKAKAGSGGAKAKAGAGANTADAAAAASTDAAATAGSDNAGVATAAASSSATEAPAATNAAAPEATSSSRTRGSGRHRTRTANAAKAATAAGAQPTNAAAANGVVAASATQAAATSSSSRGGRQRGSRFYGLW
jgi:transcription initiation factor TFIID subunit 15